MKALSSQVNGNIVPAVNYSSGSYTLTGLIVGANYYYSMGANDTLIALSVGATFAKSVSATGVFTATSTSAILTGSGTSAVGTVVAPIYGVPLFPTTVTPTTPTRQITIGQFPAANPNFSRAIQLSDQYLFVKRGTYGVAIPLGDLVNLALTDEANLTWTPPVVLSQPSAQSSSNLVPSANYSSGAYSLSGIISGQSYYWSKGANDTSLVNGSTTLTSSGVFTATTSTTILNGSGTSAITATVRPQVSFVVSAGSEYTVTYAWYESADGITWGSALTTTGIYNVATPGSLKITPTDTSKNVYFYKCVITDNAGNFGLANGSVTTSFAQLTVI